MKREVLVSVIIPVLNVRTYLAEALDSVIHQSYGNLEIILIDNGSTDGTAEICDEYSAKDARIIVVHEERKDVGNARNIGLGIMTGEAVAFLDADDVYYPDYVSTMIDAMNRSGSDIVICKYEKQETTGRLILGNTSNSNPAIEPGEYDRVSLLRAYANGKINPSIWNKVYKRELWEKERFPVGHVFEDIDTTYRVLDHCEKACVLEDVLYVYRKRPGSITDHLTKKQAGDWFLAYSHFESFVKENIPEVFPEETLKYIEQRKIFQKFIYYAHFSRKKDPELKGYGKELRQQVIDHVKAGNLSDYSITTQVYYQIMYYCPWLLSAAMKAFSRIRPFVIGAK